MASNVSKHPLYADFLDLWIKGDDSYAGEVTIKKKGTTYLPPTSGMIADGVLTGNSQTPGYQAYSAYVLRAVYPEIYKEAVKAAIGMMHRKPPTIELPNALKEMENTATPLGETLELLLRRINTRQLVTGRLGLLGDVRNNADGVPVPVVVTYYDKAILNWDDTSEDGEEAAVSLVVLDESGYVRDERLQWTMKDRCRVLALVSGEDGSKQFSYTGTYETALFDDDIEITAEGLEAPNRQGNVLSKIPFSFVNATDIAADPDIPPLEGLANLCLTIYRGEADYRQNLFMQSQDTLVLIGKSETDDEAIRTGAGACIKIKNPQGDAKYVGVGATGLKEQREALQNDYSRAFQKAGQMESQGKTRESADALEIRMAAQNATLPEIALAGAEGLQRVLKIMAEWFGANPDEVVVKPNLEFADESGDAMTLKQIIESKVLGAPLSIESIHAWMQENGFTRKTLEEELAAIQAEGGGLTNTADDQTDRRNKPNTDTED